MPDGVQVTLLWFEPKEAATDAPLVVSLHGIGGDENSVRPIVLAEECLRRGWRSVMYVRRGHGDSSLLPVGAPAEAKEAEADGGGGGKGAAPGPAPAATAPGKASEGKVAAPAAPVAAPTAAVSAEAPAAASLDLPTPPSSPPAATATAATTVTAAATTTVTILATDTAASDAGGIGPSPASSSSNIAGCLPKNLTLPLPLPILGGGGGDDAAAAAAAAAAVDPEALRRTRKAFPQHADTEDFMVVLQHIRAERPRALMVAVGFSMGSNVLVKFLGEHPPGPGAAPVAPAGGEGMVPRQGPDQGQDPGSRRGLAEEDPKNPLAAAVSVSNGYDIIEGTRNMVSSRHLADRIITAALHKLLRRKLPEVHAICAANGLLVDFDEVLSCNTIRDFERALMLPICGLEDLDTYYKYNNCRDALMNVGTPLLCLSARDDPIIHPSLLRHAEAAAAANPHVLLAVTRRGGHLGWISGWTGQSWMMDVIVQFVESVVKRHAAAAAVAAAGDAAAGAGAAAGARAPPAHPPVEDVRVGAAAAAAAATAARTVEEEAGAGGGCGRPAAERRSIDITASSSVSASPSSAAATAAAVSLQKAASFGAVSERQGLRALEVDGGRGEATSAAIDRASPEAAAMTGDAVIDVRGDGDGGRKT